MDHRIVDLDGRLRAMADASRLRIPRSAEEDLAGSGLLRRTAKRRGLRLRWFVDRKWRRLR